LAINSINASINASASANGNGNGNGDGDGDGAKLGPEPAPWSYARMRMSWCAWALRAFVRRWLVYVVVAAAVFGAGAASFTTIVMGAAAWLVLPLFYAASKGPWLLPAWALQTLFGLGLIWGLRHLLWPLAWAEAERALPIEPTHSRRSDAVVVGVALLPLFVLYAAGAAALVGQDPAWLWPSRGLALVALVASGAASLGLGVWLLQRQRRATRARALGTAPPRDQPALALVTGAAAQTTASATAAVTTSAIASAIAGAIASAIAIASALAVRWARLQQLWCLLCLPLWRGPATRSGQALGLGTLALAVPVLGLAASSAGADWWLAAFALLALLVATRVNHLLREELTPLLQACAPLPLSSSRLQRLCASLGLWPLCLMLPFLWLVLLGLPTGGQHLRPAVWASYVLACLGSAALEVFSAPAPAEAKAARWLFCLALCVALATEVMGGP
jgi:hypothetical protein